MVYNVIVVFERDGSVYPFGHTYPDDFFLRNASHPLDKAESLASAHASMWYSTVEKCVVVQVEV